MPHSFFHTLQKLYRGQSLARIRMDQAMSHETLSGKVVDVGGGRNPDYLHYFKKQDEIQFEAVDQSISGIDFEKDTLPYADASVDTLICANVLEHVFHYQFLVGEMHRVLKQEGILIGFVPFLVNYHPDPHDYFRYTKESLKKIFSEAGFAHIEIRAVGGGPFSVNFNNIVLSMPRVLRPLVYLPYAASDFLFTSMSSSARERYPLGFLFVVGK